MASGVRYEFDSPSTGPLCNLTQEEWNRLMDEIKAKREAEKARGK